MSRIQQSLGEATKSTHKDYFSFGIPGFERGSSIECVGIIWSAFEHINQGISRRQRPC